MRFFFSWTDARCWAPFLWRNCVLQSDNDDTKVCAALPGAKERWAKNDDECVFLRVRRHRRDSWNLLDACGVLSRCWNPSKQCVSQGCRRAWWWRFRGNANVATKIVHNCSSYNLITTLCSETYLALPYVLPYILPYHTPYLTLRLTLPNVLPYLTSSLALPYLTLPCPTLPYLNSPYTLPYLTSTHLILSYLTSSLALSYLTLPYLTSTHLTHYLTLPQLMLHLTLPYIFHFLTLHLTLL